MKRLSVASSDWNANLSDVLESLREVGDLDAAPYGGARFPLNAQLAGRTFAKFHLDVSSGDVMREPYEALSGRDWAGFAGIAGTTCPAVSMEEHFAEKLHAYTKAAVAAVPSEQRASCAA